MKPPKLILVSAATLLVATGILSNIIVSTIVKL